MKPSKIRKLLYTHNETCTFTTVTVGLALLTRIQVGWPVRLRVILLVVYLIEPMRNTRGISNMQSVLNHAHCLVFCRSNVWFKDSLPLLKFLVVSVYLCTNRLRQTNTNFWHLSGLLSLSLMFHSDTHKRTTSVSKSAYYKNTVIILSDNYQFSLPVGSSNPRIPLTWPTTLAAVSDKRWLSY